MIRQKAHHCLKKTLRIPQLTVNDGINHGHQNGSAHDISKRHGDEVVDEELAPVGRQRRGSVPVKMAAGTKNMLATQCSMPIATKAMVGNHSDKILPAVSLAA